jgi:hyperosmotically inducible protein
MKKLTSVLIGSLLLASTVACSNVEKTSDKAPNSTNTSTQAPDANKAQEINKDATDQTRRNQLNSDIRAREQRNKAGGDQEKRADSDLKSEIRSKLEANLPASQLAVDSKDGNVSISGTVPTEPQLKRIEPLAKQIKGVKSVEVKATVAPAKP